MSMLRSSLDMTYHSYFAAPHLLQEDAVDPGPVCYKAKRQATHQGGGPKALHQELGVDVLA